MPKEVSRMDRTLVGHGEAYYDAIDEITHVLRSHFPPINERRPKDDAYEFTGEYRSFRDDFWTKEDADIALENLSRSLQNLYNAHEAVPKLVRETLTARARGIDWERQEELEKETTADAVSQTTQPIANTTIAAEALEVLVVNKEALRSAITVVRKELPEGIKTRNRPGRAWAVVHAAARVSRGSNGINIPKAIDQSGPFYRLLTDLFELFEITETVQGAFRGWRTHMDGKYENLDLMPIE